MFQTLRLRKPQARCNKDVSKENPGFGYESYWIAKATAMILPGRIAAQRMCCVHMCQWFVYNACEAK